MWFKSHSKEHADHLIDKAHHELEKENILAAISLLEHAMKLDKEYATPYGEYGVALALQKNNDDQAEYNGQFAVIKSSKCPIQWRNLAQIYCLLGKLQRAYAAIIVAQSIDPDSEQIQKIRMEIEAFMGPDQIETMEKIEHKAQHAFSSYGKSNIIVPDQFFQEALTL